MLEIRCIECGWLDPKLWSCYKQCNCSHYFRIPEDQQDVATIQLVFWASGEVGLDEHVRKSPASHLPS